MKSTDQFTTIVFTMAVIDQQFVQFLKTRPAQRTDLELRYICYCLQTLQPVRNVSHAALNALSRTVYYDYRDHDTNVYNAKDVATCWFILLSGTVYVQTPEGFQTFKPNDSFGTEVTEDGRRGYACYALEFSEFIVIDFPNKNICPYTSAETVASKIRAKGYAAPASSHQYSYLSQSQVYASKIGSESIASQLSQNHSQGVYEQAKACNAGAYLNLELVTPRNKPPLPPHRPRPNSYNNRLSMSSNGSSFQTSDGESLGSNPKLDDYHVYSHVSKPMEPVYYCSPPEEELYAEIHYYDACFDELKILKKSPVDRSFDDVKLLADFLQHFSAFSSMSFEMRLDFSYVMKYAHVEDKNKVILASGEKLDSWCVVINGQCVNIKEDGSRKVFTTGQFFGLDRKQPTPQFHMGTMVTLERDCQFVAIPEKDFFEVVQKHSQYERILCDGSNRPVLVTEARDLTNYKIEDENLVVKMGEPTRLVSHLVEDHSASETSYVEDFLLTYRTFIKDPTYVSEKLEKWFNDQSSTCMRDRIVRVVFCWVANHYIDFEASSSLSFFLEKFHDKLQTEGKTKEGSNLVKICGKKGKMRKVELDSVMRRDELPFNLMTPFGGKGAYIKTFKQKVEGLKVGDHVIAVNNKNVENLSFKEAISIIASQEYCWLTVKHHVLGMKRSTSKQNSHPSDSIDGEKTSGFLTGSRDLLGKNESSCVPVINKGSDTSEQSKNSRRLERSKLKRRFPFFPPNPLTKMLNNSTSNPDVSNLNGSIKIDEASDFALKIYTAEQQYKYLSFSELTSIRHIVNKAVDAFELQNANDYVLCHVEVSTTGMVKQTRLAEQHKDIIDRIRPASRFYVKPVNLSERLLPQESISELQKEAKVQFLELKPLELAIQLTLRDLAVVQKILPHQYVEMLWKLPPKDLKYQSYTTIDDFTDLSNKEMFWVIHTICSEKSLSKRAKVVKQFIKIAKFCRELRNFNSMFAILSGLGHNCVSRLDFTLEKVPSREAKLKSVLDEVLDPSRNMAKYRNLLTAYKGSTPVIPIYPILIKDLTVFHLGNESKIDDLINFEKLRLISKEIKCFYTSISSNPDRDFLKSLVTKPSKVIANAEQNGLTSHERENSRSVTDVSMHAPMAQRNGILHKSRKSLLLGSNNPKRIYEEILMCKRVEQYIKNLSVISDEELLRKMSVECEPDDYESEIESMPTPAPLPKASVDNQKSEETTSTFSDNISIRSQEVSKNHYDIVSSDGDSIMSDPCKKNNVNDVSKKNMSKSNADLVLNVQIEDTSPRISFVGPYHHQTFRNPLQCAVPSPNELQFERMSVASSSSPGSKLAAVTQLNSTSRDSLSSASSSSSRSKSTSRVDDRTMRIPATPSFATNKQIPVKHSATSSSSPPIQNNLVMPNRGSFNLETSQKSNFVYQSYPQPTVGLGNHGSKSMAQISYARSMSLLGPPPAGSKPSAIFNPATALPPKLVLSSDGALRPNIKSMSNDRDLNL